MTTPFPEPYGTVYRGTGQRATLDPRTGTLLPVGVNTISASTRHPGQITVRAYRDAEWAQSIVLGTIPEGSGQRSIAITFGVKTGDYRALSVDADAVAGPDVQVDVSVITLPLKAAG